jgi:hypothetical protein
MIEIYNRDPNDPMYKENVLEVTDPVEICIGQLKMCLLTNREEVLGDPSFGLSLEYLLFDLDLSEQSIRSRIMGHLRNYVPLFQELGGTFEIKFYQGTLRDIAIFDFYIPASSSESPIITLRVF